MKLIRFIEANARRRWLSLSRSTNQVIWAGVEAQAPSCGSARFSVALACRKVPCRRMSEIRHNTGQDEAEDENSLLAARIKSDIPPKPSSFGFIFRVPERIRVAGEDTYDPRILAIGPYHAGEKKLNATEKYKAWYLDSFISRMAAPETSLTDIVKAIKELEVSARDCYGEPIHLTSDEFVRMMILDGCFILELFYRFSVGKKNVKSKDVIFNTTWILPSLRRDLLLLENQIPFVVLECLFNLTDCAKQGDRTLYEVVTTFFNPILPATQNTERNSSTESKHILDLLRTHLIRPFQLKEYGEYPHCEYTQSARVLWQAGVKFKKKDETQGLLNITFTKKGELEIPSFHFGVSWIVLLPNLVALEQCRQDYTAQITSYVILMDSLVNTHRDVKLLCDKGIINKLFQEDESVALAINSLYKRVVVDEFYYDGLCREVNAYSRAKMPQWIATLNREYFDTPWSTAKVVTACILLFLTFKQTYPSFPDSLLIVSKSALRFLIDFVDDLP